jgi:hypothetical protein
LHADLASASDGTSGAIGRAGRHIFRARGNSARLSSQTVAHDVPPACRQERSE